MPHPLRVLYLHGFASGPGSRKARFFKEQLAKLGIPIQAPDLAEGDFERLTVTGQLKLIESIVGADPVILIGSSLGGYLAALYAARHPEVVRLVLLAPAFCFHASFEKRVGPSTLELWKRQGSLPVFHYGSGGDMPLSYQILEDAATFEPFPDFHQPALIFHGNQDPIVPVSYSREFVAEHANTTLIELDSGHELTDALSIIWEHSQPFLTQGIQF